MNTTIHRSPPFAAVLFSPMFSREQPGGEEGVLRPAGNPAVHRHRQGSAQRHHGGGLSPSNASAETIAGEKLDIVEVRDRRVSDPVVGPSGTSVDRPRMVEVTGAMITEWRSRPNGSRVRRRRDGSCRGRRARPRPTHGGGHEGSSAYRASQSVSSPMPLGSPNDANSNSSTVGGMRWYAAMSARRRSAWMSWSTPRRWPPRWSRRQAEPGLRRPCHGPT